MSARIISGLLAALLALVPLRADNATAIAPVGTPVTDPALVAQHFRQVAARPEFVDAQDSGVKPRVQDLLAEWFQDLGRRIGDFKYTSRMPAFESLLMSFLVVFSLAVLGYIVFRLTRGHVWTWRGEDESPPPGRQALREPESYDEEIICAVKSRDWHTAWLAAWRQFLSRLERRSLVEADRTRTNREYLSQLRAKPLPAPTLALLIGMVDAYDRFIYGRTAIGEAEWNRFRQQIEEAALLLHLDDKRTQVPVPGVSA